MKRPFYPFLLAAYFVLALLGLNISQVQPEAAIRALVVVLAIAGLLSLFMRWLYKDSQRGALAGGLLLILFFTYGHVYNFLEKTVPALGRHRLLLPIWLLLAGMGLWLISRRLRDPLSLTKALNVVALVALAFPVYQIAIWEIRLAATGTNPAVNIPGLGSLHLPANQTPPDVYFILLDEYTRQDVLSEVYHFDNSAFLDQLKQMGFVIVDCSQSNYSQTEMVLTSIMNLNYLDALGKFDPGDTEHATLRQLIRNNAVNQTFHQLGYQLVAFETGFHFSEFYNADFYLSPGGRGHDLLGGMNAFEVLLFKSTAGLALLDFAQVLPSFLVPDTSQPLETKRQQVLFDLEELGTIPQSIPGPKFVFAHILLLHEPFVFTADGSAVDYPDSLDEEQYLAAYRDQVVFLNSRLLPILQNIIANTDPPPIIILQGDTGPGRVSHAGRMENLSAFYLPGYAQSLPTTLTPVNDFRLVFDHYFGAALGMLPDVSYFSLYTTPYDFTQIPNECGK